MMTFPVISHIKSFFKKIFIFRFCQHKNRFNLLHFFYRRFPKFCWYFPGNITSKTINILLFYPITHILTHFSPQCFIVVIKISYICPPPALASIRIYRVYNLSVFVFSIKFGMFFNPNMIPAGMICYPIQDHIHAVSMSCFYQFLKIL